MHFYLFINDPYDAYFHSTHKSHVPFMVIRQIVYNVN
jgi:hypothetical protein